MATYVIGDLQGCWSSFKQLAAQLPAADRYIFVGDLVNRGSESLATLRQIKTRVEHGKAVALLGNHDLHLLAVAAGVRRLKDGDTLQEVLDAPDCDELLVWIRGRPLAHFEDGVLFVHAGVLPPWTVEQTLALADEVHRSLAADDENAFLRQMYGDEPSRGGYLTATIDCAALSMRSPASAWCHATAHELKHKDKAARRHAVMCRGLNTRACHARQLVVFGHWSAEGLVARSNVIGLDTGFVWGGKLTALRLQDRALFQRDCPESQSADE